MRYLTIFAIMLTALAVGVSTRDQGRFVALDAASASADWTQLGTIAAYRDRAQDCAHALTGHRWAVSKGTPQGRQYRRWVIALWRNRLVSCTAATNRSRRDPVTAIIVTFGRHAPEAIRVARCESHLTTTAVNGQYLGLFQMGSDERRIYGHGPTAIEQARAAHRYFVASGSDWSPWSCKP